MFLSLYEGQSVKIQNILIEQTNTVTTYNIEVEDYHTYYVGKTGVLVHNAGCGKSNAFRPDGKEGYRAVVNSAETEAPHAHIFKKQNNIGRIFSDGSMDKSLISDRKALKFVKKYADDIMELIQKFYGKI